MRPSDRERQQGPQDYRYEPPAHRAAVVGSILKVMLATLIVSTSVVAVVADADFSSPWIWVFLAIVLIVNIRFLVGESRVWRNARKT